MSLHDQHKAWIAPLRASLATADGFEIRNSLHTWFSTDCDIHLGAPFGALRGPDALFETVYDPLLAALPDMERRDWIVMAGPRWGGGQPGNWIGIAGTIVGTFDSPWLGIPPTGGPVAFRYQEYLRVQDDKIVEMFAFWDLGEVMQHAGVWPMAPQLGAAWLCPGPAHGAGFPLDSYDQKRSSNSVQLVWDMLHDLKQGTAAAPERGLGGFWHENAVWYGSAGFGLARGHAQISNRIFRQFREGLSENTRHLEDGVFFGDGDLVGFAGWPSGTAVHSGDGFLGLVPTGRVIKRRSLDFWRIAQGKIHECWVMIDMIDLYRQLGVDVFARMRALVEFRAA